MSTAAAMIGQGRRLRRRGVLIGGMALVGCGRVERPVLVAPASGGASEATIVVVRRRWHAEVAFAAGGAMPAPLDAAVGLFPGAAWVSVGFGDRAFFQPGGEGVLTALRALLGAPAALLVTGLAQDPAISMAGDEQVRLRISAAGRAALLGFMAGQMESAQPMARGPFPGGLFFATSLRYGASYTCNTWTMDSMRAAGLPVSADGVLFAGQVMARARAVGS